MEVGLGSNNHTQTLDLVPSHTLMAYNPNFPPSLFITPNVGHDILRHDVGDVFGVEAQREAISRYGIAGRVW